MYRSMLVWILLMWSAHLWCIIGAGWLYICGIKSHLHSSEILQTSGQNSFIIDKGYKYTLLVSQLVPVYPAGHWQMKLLSCGWHFMRPSHGQGSAKIVSYFEPFPPVHQIPCCIIHDNMSSATSFRTPMAKSLYMVHHWSLGIYLPKQNLATFLAVLQVIVYYIFIFLTKCGQTSSEKHI